MTRSDILYQPAMLCRFMDIPSIDSYSRAVELIDDLHFYHERHRRPSHSAAGPFLCRTSTLSATLALQNYHDKIAKRITSNFPARPCCSCVLDNFAAVEQADHAGALKNSEYYKRWKYYLRAPPLRLHQGALHPHVRPSGRLRNQSSTNFSTRPTSSSGANNSFLSYDSYELIEQGASKQPLRYRAVTRSAMTAAVDRTAASHSVIPIVH
eukprot:1626894-Pleurochrysis_carterae.AAC.4